MAQQVMIGRDALAPSGSGRETSGGVRHVAPDIAYLRTLIVNVVYLGRPADRNWVLVDSGVHGTAAQIARAADQRFGGHPPRAIVLTHGHFDHVGALEKLARRWDVPVYAHPHEFAFLAGEQSYPPPDPAVGGGLMALLSPLYPRGPVDVRPWLRPLPVDGSVPDLPGWHWIYTPGHTRGHISLWRPSDRSLIAGDAFVTTAQESLYSVATQAPEMHGPPMYFTENWKDAEQSVRRLAELEPELAVTGHGPALRGPAMRSALRVLARHFGEIAVPGRRR